MAKTRRNQKAGGFFDWLFGKKNEAVMANGATAPMENPVPANATAVQVNEVATPISNVVGGARKSYKAKANAKAYRKGRKDRKATKAQRKSRKSRKAHRKVSRKH
jgi:hypothetical protein